MIASVLPVIAPIFVCVLVGYLWKLFQQPYDTQMVSRLVMTIGAPALIISTLSKTPVSVPILYEMIWVCGSLMAAMLLFGAILLKSCRLDVRSYINTLAFPNIGNMGLPVCLFAFGEHGLALAIALFMIFCVVQFSLGIFLVSGQSFLKVFLTNPVIYSVFAGVAMIYMDVSLPQWMARSVDLLGSIAIPMMLISLGVSLAGLKVTSFRESVILAIMRLALGLFCGWLVVEIFDVEGTMRAVVLIQAAMPTAVFNYMFASQYQRNPQQVAGTVVLSTVLGFVTLPWLLLWAKGTLL
ncbi:MAG: AEC family transporter [Pseudomonadales bacterium]|nr:AEC family transporter [Pseudomonadales bacterium]